MELLESIRDFLEYTLLNIRLKELIIFLLVVFVSLFFRQIFAKVVLKFLKKITSKTDTTFDDNLIQIIETPLKFLIAVTGFSIAFSFLSLSENASNFVNHIIKSMIIFIFFWGIYRAEELLGKLIEKLLTEKNMELTQSFLPFINKFLKVTVVIFGFIFIVQEWGYNIGAIITGLGIGGVAVALAAKDTLANLFGSVMILIDKPFKIGDFIICNDTEGTVEEIGFRSTRIRTLTRGLVSIPNSNVATTSITNWTLRDRRRMQVNIGVTYSTPMSKLQEAVNRIRTMLMEDQNIFQDDIKVYFSEFSASSLDIFINCFAQTTDWGEYLAIKQEVNFRIMEIFEELKIDFAFNSLSVYVEKK